MYGFILISYAYALQGDREKWSCPIPSPCSSPRPIPVSARRGNSGQRHRKRRRCSRRAASRQMRVRANNRADCGSHRRSHGGATTDAIHPVVEISPPDIVSRRVITWHGMTAETVKTTKQVNVEYCFRAPMHLLVAYEEGERRSGETFVEGAPRSNLRNFARKLTFVPAGHEYREWHDPLTRSRRTHFYFDPAKLEFGAGDRGHILCPAAVLRGCNVMGHGSQAEELGRQRRVGRSALF